MRRCSHLLWRKSSLSRLLGTLGETPLRTPNDASPRVIEQMVRQLVGMMGAALGAASSSGPSASACLPMFLIHVYLHMSAPPAHSPASPEETVCIICMDEPRAMPRSCMAIRATCAAASSVLRISRPRVSRAQCAASPSTSSSGSSRKPGVHECAAVGFTVRSTVLERNGTRAQSFARCDAVPVAS